jgi:phosphoribosylaminoimidazole carboxylase (NCAIR synthetase)
MSSTQDRNILILGAGQLGLMMAIEAAKLGLTLDRLDPNII